jgi:hypothetical protein
MAKKKDDFPLRQWLKLWLVSLAFWMRLIFCFGFTVCGIFDLLGGQFGDAAFHLLVAFSICPIWEDLQT